MSDNRDLLVEDYLNRLRTALEVLPETRRDEIVEDVTAHITESRRQLADESDAGLRTLLDHIGSPEEIAATALGDEPSTPPRPARRRWRLPTAVGAVVLAGGIALGLAVTATPSPPARHLNEPTQPFEVLTIPNLVGETPSAAAKQLEALGFRFIYQTQIASSRQQAGIVLQQAPAAGSALRRGSTVTVSVGAGTSESTTTTIISTTTTLPPQS